MWIAVVIIDDNCFYVRPKITNKFHAAIRKSPSVPNRKGQIHNLFRMYRRDQDERSKLKMSRFLQEEAILDVLEAEYESSCSEIENVENVSIHETNSEEDADLYDHQSHKLPLPPLDQPLGVRNWRDLQVSHDYLEDIPVQFPRRGKFTGKDNIKKWQVCTPPQNVSTRAHNIVLTVPGRAPPAGLNTDQTKKNLSQGGNGYSIHFEDPRIATHRVSFAADSQQIVELERREVRVKSQKQMTQSN
ncbi:hypothetical protein ACJJTC_011390 [Scirpophaga incertulas]